MSTAIGTRLTSRLAFIAPALVSFLFYQPAVSMAQSPKTEMHQQIMERKLETTSKILEAIARADFDGVAQQSQRLHLLSREAAWNVLATSEYLELSEDFRTTVQRLERAARTEDLDAVGLNFIKLNITCIECHRYSRAQTE